MEIPEREIQAGAAALVKGGVVRDLVGDVLHDHDWTPMEATKAVLEAAAAVRGAVDPSDPLGGWSTVYWFPALEEARVLIETAEQDGYVSAGWREDARRWQECWKAVAPGSAREGTGMS